MPEPNPPRRRLEDDAEQLARDVAHDTVQAAKATWRIATRLGGAALKRAEEATDRVADEIERRGKKRSGMP